MRFISLSGFGLWEKTGHWRTKEKEGIRIFIVPHIHFQGKNIVLCQLVFIQKGKKIPQGDILGGTTPTDIHNELSTCRKMYYYKGTWVMASQ